MYHPWDPPPFPELGDAEDKLTYAAVGRAMSQWEAVELRLAFLLGNITGRLGAVEEYGKGRIFKDRIAALEDAAANFFVRTPSQDLEGKFDTIIAACKGFSSRRNEIAHGIVLDTASMEFFSSKYVRNNQNNHFVLIPPIYLDRKHINGLPVFCYTSKTINSIFYNIRSLADEIKIYTNSNRFLKY